MTADVEMLPLPSVLLNWPHPTNHAAIRDYARANVAHATAAKDAEIARLTDALEFQSGLTKNLLPYQDEAVASRVEIEALRAEVERLKALVRSVGYETLTRAEQAEARAERLAEALQKAEEYIDDVTPSWASGGQGVLAIIRAALHPTTAQENDDA